MGAVLSVPLMALTLVMTLVALCLGAATCSALCSSIGGTFKLLILTRITYAFMFVVNLVMLWVVLLLWVANRLEKILLGLVKFKCEGELCVLFLLVHRIQLALGVMHLTLALLLVGIRSTANPRAQIQNGWWRFKVFAWLLLVVLLFLVPDAFFVWWGNHMAMVFSTVFIGIGLILLVDFAHEWAEVCLRHIEDDEAAGEESSFWKNLLVGGTLLMFVGTVVLTGIMYAYFAAPGCHMNQAAISINLAMAIVVAVLLIHPAVQEYNPRAGLAQAAMVCIYGSYLTMLAVALEPDDKMCNPLVRSRGTRTASIVLGAFFTFVAIAYTTTRAAANSAFGDYDTLLDHGVPALGPVTEQPLQRREMRLAAIRQAVDEGSLPELALHQAELVDDLDDDGGVHVRSSTSNEHLDDEERKATKYNYALFHLIFFLATQYTALLLTVNVQADDLGDFVPVGRTYFSAWVKIVSTWVCYVLFEWSLVAPALFPDRFAVLL